MNASVVYRLQYSSGTVFHNSTLQGVRTSGPVYSALLNAPELLYKHFRQLPATGHIVTIYNCADLMYNRTVKEGGVLTRIVRSY